MSFTARKFLTVSTPTTWNVGIQTTSTNQTFSVNIFSGTSPNITVDWGDGTVETFTTTGVKTRTYASAGSYIVKISGSFASNGNIRLGSTNDERARVQSTAVIPTIPGLTSFSETFLGCTSLTSIPAGLFAYNIAVTSFSQTFNNCTSLTTVPAGLFDNNTAVFFFTGIFNSCTSLTSIPAGLFDNNTVVISFSVAFGGCTSLTTVPAGLFANNTLVTSSGFSAVFEGVTLTTESYSNLLINIASNAASRSNNVFFSGGNSKYNTAGQTARNTLINTKGWSFNDGGPEPWNVGIQTTSTNQTFSVNIAAGTSPNITVDWGDGAVQTFTTTGVKTRTYASAGTYIVKISGSFASGGNIRLGSTNDERARVQSTSVIPTIQGLTSFDSTFANCSSLTSIPAGLFANNTAVTSFTGTFESCTSLTSIPSTLFANNTAVTSFDSTFFFCSSLTSIPAGLFDNNTAVTNFSSTFRVCISLTSIPSTLFANNTAVTNFGSTFLECVSLTSIPAGLFAYNIAVTSFSQTFNNCTSLTTVPAGLFDNNTAVTGFLSTFQNCFSLTTVPSGLFANNTAVNNFGNIFNGVTLTTTSYSNLLINMALNAASRNNNVSFGGGNSKYNTDGQTARNTFIAKNWTFTDGGLDI